MVQNAANSNSHKRFNFVHLGELTTDTKVALDMSGTSLGGGDSPLVRLGFVPTSMAPDVEEEEGFVPFAILGLKLSTSSVLALRRLFL